MELLERYVETLVDWNKKINLVSRKDVENVWENHILHSISLLFKLQLEENTRLLDLGTGGGLPGIPLKILMPSLKLTMLDATQKKIHAVQEIIGRLDLAQTQAVWGRAEEMARRPEYTKAFDYVVARAVAPLDDLVRLSIPLLGSSNKKKEELQRRNEKMHTRPPALMAFKGGAIDEELKRVAGHNKEATIDVVALNFEGSEEISFTDKKLVVVKF